VCLVYAQEAGDQGGSAVCRVEGVLFLLRIESKWSCEGSEGGKGLHGGCWGTLQEGIVCIRQRLCQVHCCDLLEWPSQSDGKKQRSKGVTLLFPTLRGDYSSGGLVHKEVAVPAIGPYHHGKQGWAALLDDGQHLVPAQGVQGVLPVHLHSCTVTQAGATAMRALRGGSTAWLTCSGDRLRLASGQAARAQRVVSLYQTFLAAMGQMACRRGGAGEGCRGPLLGKSEHGGAGLFAAAAGGSLDVLVRPATGSHSRPVEQGLQDPVWDLSSEGCRGNVGCLHGRNGFGEVQGL
jgi:hypothetical protein